MEEQQQAGEQKQRRAAAGSGGRGGARTAAQGPHHGGRLTRSGAPPAGNPGHPRRGVAAATSAVATPVSAPPHRRPRDPGGRPQRESGRGSGELVGGRESGSLPRVRAGRAGGGAGAEAALPSGMRRGGSGAALGGGRRGGAERRLRAAAAARSGRRPDQHLPLSRGARPRPPGTRGARGGGFLRTRSGRDC